jgi:hypothetical protein
MLCTTIQFVEYLGKICNSESSFIHPFLTFLGIPKENQAKEPYSLNQTPQGSGYGV